MRRCYHLLFRLYVVAKGAQRNRERPNSYRNALDLNYRLYVVEATVENKCTVSVCVFKTTTMQGAEKMYQALLSSPATSNCLEATGRENTRLGHSG